MVREGVSIGVDRDTAPAGGRFTEKQIALVKTFADQAVIAIENVRLFRTETRNAELTESLEQQTATADILRVIASSPTDLQPVMDVVAESAAKFCGATNAAIWRLEGDSVRLVAVHGSMRRQSRSARPSPPLANRDRTGVRDRQTIHVEDLLACRGGIPGDGSRHGRVGPAARRRWPRRSCAKARRSASSSCSRTEVQRFTDKQIALIETFADQAVIAIENVRLFQELEARTRDLTRSVGELQALSEVSRTVSSTSISTLCSDHRHARGAAGRTTALSLRV